MKTKNQSNKSATEIAQSFVFANAQTNESTAGGVGDGATDGKSLHKAVHSLVFRLKQMKANQRFSINPISLHSIELKGGRNADE